MTRRVALFTSSIAAMLLAAGSASAAWFLTLESPRGETQTIELQDFDLGGEHAATIGSSTQGAGAGKIHFSDFTITKKTDASSPAFFKNCVAGAHYKTVVLAMRKAGSDPSSVGKPYLIFHFYDVTVSRASAADHSAGFHFVRSEVQGVPAPTPTPAMKVLKPGAAVLTK